MGIEGNITALITPMKKDGQVDFARLEKLIEYQIAAGTRGLVVLGSTGEAAMLSPSEQHEVMTLACRVVQKRVPIIAGLSAFSLEQAKRCAAERIEEGADALLIAPPPYIRPTSEGLLSYFLELAAFSRVPIIIYNIPSRTGVSLGLDVVEELAQNENIIGIKEASGDLGYAAKLSRLCGADFALICGNDHLILPYLSLGCRCAISVIGNAAPAIMNELISRFDQKPDQCRELFNKYARLIELASLSNPCSIKFVLAQLKLAGRHLRAPLCSPPREVQKQILSELKALEG